jgi:pilus assembly protein CpaB
MKIIASPRWRLAASLMFGVVVAIVTQIYFSRTEHRLQTRFTLATALRAKRFIDRDHAVTADLVEEVSIPGEAVQPTAVRSKKELLDAAGRDGAYKARTAFLKGEFLMRSKLYQDNAAQGLGWLLPSGQTALALRLAPEQAVAGLVQPGDWVHVLCTIQPSVDRALTRIILRRVQILAVGDQIYDAAAAALTKNTSKNMANDTLLITLGVTPAQAALAALASEKGKLTLILAPSLEEQLPPSATATMEDLGRAERG